MSVYTPRNELLRSRLSRFFRGLHGVEEGIVSAIHRTRVASRRLREVLPILQLDNAVTTKLNRRLRKVTRRLGTARELDVLLALVDELGESRRHSERALKFIKDDVVLARARIGADLTAKDTAADLRRVARKLGKALKQMDSSGDTANEARAVFSAIEARVARRADAVKLAITDAGGVYLAERLHAVRIAVKKLRYGVELHVEASGDRDSGDLRALKRGQELLGRMHDLQVMIDRVRQVQGALTPPDVIVWRELDALVTLLENSCRRLHARYMRERPALLALCDRYKTRAPVARTFATRRAG
jgi:CHAD domain-containing protein